MNGDDAIIGDPIGQVDAWEQQTLNFDCGVVSQMSIINQFLDHPISEAQAVFEATSYGWLTENGTSPDDIGKLFELHGIENHRVDGASIQQLAWELEQGHRVIVGVHSSELWSPNNMMENMRDALGLAGADHAVSVTGLDLSDPEHPLVLLNDPGDPNGACHPYPLEQFIGAWENSNFFYVATNEAPPHVDFRSFSIADYTDISSSVVFEKSVDELLSAVNWDSILTST